MRAIYYTAIVTFWLIKGIVWILYLAGLVLLTIFAVIAFQLRRLRS